jgi:hypothetical protein
MNLWFVELHISTTEPILLHYKENFWTLLKFQYLSDRTHFFLPFVHSIVWLEVILLSYLHHSMHPFESQCLSFLNIYWDVIFHFFHFSFCVNLDQFVSIINPIQFSNSAKASAQLVKYDLVRNSLSSFQFENHYCIWFSVNENAKFQCSEV